MATTEMVVLICDDPRHYDEAEAVVSRSIAIDGNAYEIELCSVHNEEYQAALAPFLTNARAVRPASPAKRTKEVRQHTATVRAWWRNHQVAAGMPYTERGRIPASVTAAYARRS